MFPTLRSLHNDELSHARQLAAIRYMRLADTIRVLLSVGREVPLHMSIGLKNARTDLELLLSL